MTSLRLGMLTLVILAPGRADDDVLYQDQVRKLLPVAYWSFEGSETRTGDVDGEIEFGAAGPASAQFKWFRDDNRAARFGRKAGFIRLEDVGPGSQFDFDNGDPITIEAWVQPEPVGNGSNIYLLGKGRTNNPGVPADNQNYALRLREKDGELQPSFLFRSRAGGGHASDWHRWTATTGIRPGSGWHHVAVTYVFGKPESFRCYIDAELVDGVWDMGGKTDRPPVVDDDEIWVGSSIGGNANVTYHGLLDEVALYRRALTEEQVARRYPIGPYRPVVDLETLPTDVVRVEVVEGLRKTSRWPKRFPEPTETWTEDAFGFFQLPQKYNARGVRADRSNPYLLRAVGRVRLPVGEHRILLRTRGKGRLWLDEEVIAETAAPYTGGGAHNDVRELAIVDGPDLRYLGPGDREHVVTFNSDGAEHVFVLEMVAGNGSVRATLGETTVSSARDDQPFALLSPGGRPVPLTDAGWEAYRRERTAFHAALDSRRRTAARADDDGYWEQRHARARAILAERRTVEVPGVTPGLPARTPVDRFLTAAWAKDEVPEVSALTNDLEFLRRVTLDTVGVVPTAAEIAAFQNSQDPQKRAAVIDRLLADPRWADHWVSYWQDVLAENPNILKPSLNNTGPFRFWIYESLLDDKALDRFVTELVMMEGSRQLGGPAGFGLATQNDVPMAAKAHVLGTAFLGLEMKCARCHDAPFHDTTQQDLFQVAAMLNRKPLKIPATSTVPPDAIPAGRESLITVSLRAGAQVAPAWPFAERFPFERDEDLLQRTDDSREQLAAWITSPRNERFGKVIVNRVWRRLMGAGFVEPVEDWDSSEPSHPELLTWLADEFVDSGYDLKHVTRVILNSDAYQRRPRPADTSTPDFAAPRQRRMSAEQVVDSLFASVGLPLDSEELSFDVDGTQVEKNMISLGYPRRAWEFTSLSNERDRPSLAIPKAQAIVDVLENFGWRSSRQEPLSCRDTAPNVRQPAIVANGAVGRWVTTLTDDHGVTRLALQESLTLDELIDAVYLRLLTRVPSEAERRLHREMLAAGFAQRVVPMSDRPTPKTRERLRHVSWSNHLSAEANRIKIEMERRAREGDPPTVALQPEWRERMEDMLWALMNSPEFVFLP